MCRFLLIGLFSSIGMAALCSLSFARLLEAWPYDRLLRASDLVVIAAPVSTKLSGETNSDNIWKTKMIGENTLFRIKSVNKGLCSDSELTVLHFKLEKGVKIESGPLLVSFRLKEFKVKTQQGMSITFGRPDYLLFLKKRKDGRYEQVSGQIDPSLSVRELIQVLPEERERD